MIASILPQSSFLTLTITFNCLQATNANLFHSVYSSSFKFLWYLLCMISLSVNDSVMEYFAGTRTKIPIKSGLKPSCETHSMIAF